MAPKDLVRTRFAPSPSGTIHLGNVRAAFLNLLFAKKMHGKFVLRIEDTDKEKVTKQYTDSLLQDLQWLGICYDEGPGKQGENGSYFQSARTELYQKMLQPFIANNKVYRCFCSKERLEEMREKQTALRQPPRYDRFCLGLSADEVAENLAQQKLFVWRFLLNHEEKVRITDLLRGEVTFDLKNFTDFVISRCDGSFNFLFANFVDDVEMKISHIIRGEDHLSNSASQAVLYQTIGAPLPTFMHLPLILDSQGQKLSKREKNFDLHALRDAGFLPEAICCYLASLGSNLGDEPYFFTEMLEKYDFTSLSTQSVRYDSEKLVALNHKFIRRLSEHELLGRLENLNPTYAHFKEQGAIEKILLYGRENAATLQDLATLCQRILLGFNIDDAILEKAQKLASPQVAALFEEFLQREVEVSSALLQELINKYKLAKKEVFTLLRLACLGESHGFAINQIFEVLAGHEIIKRVGNLVERLR